MTEENNEPKKIPEKREDSFTTKDRHIAIALHSLGNNPIEIVYRYVPKYQMFYRFDNSALPHLKQYTFGEDLSVNIKDYEKAEKLFRDNLYRGKEEAPKVEE